MADTYRYILFDLDGTLTDSAEGIVNSVLFALNKMGIQENDREKLRLFVGPPLVDSFMRFYGLTEEQAKEGVHFYREYFSAKGWAENLVYEGIPEVLNTLKEQGKHLLVATSKPEEYAVRIMKHFQIDQYFEIIGGASMDEKRNRKADVIRYVLDQIGEIRLDQMIMVGDREYDVFGAKAEGLPCVGVLYGYGSREELEQAGASVICPTVPELLNYL